MDKDNPLFFVVEKYPIHYTFADYFKRYFFMKSKFAKRITTASRSLVPPAYSYHSIGDFDVGKRGWGHENFTANFARTQEFWSLQKLPYISMRYTVGNADGVRFEPWHVQIV